MAETQLNNLTILVGVFVLLILGTILLGVIADDIESVSESTVTVANETLSFTTITTDVVNEAIIMTNGTIHNLTGNLTFIDLTAITEIRNISAQIVTGDCNVTLDSGFVGCNFTGYPAQLFFDYTYISGRSETLDNDEVTTINFITNASLASPDLTGFCNVTLSSGTLLCNNTMNSAGNIGYAYTPDNFVRGSAARSILRLTVLFFALFILAMAILLVKRTFFNDLF